MSDFIIPHVFSGSFFPISPSINLTLLPKTCHAWLQYFKNNSNNQTYVKTIMSVNWRGSYSHSGGTAGISRSRSAGTVADHQYAYHGILPGGGTAVSFRLMASQETTVTVNNGIESKTYNVTAGADASQASFIEVPIGEDCDITVYGDAELIDFVDMEGLYLSSFDATPLSNLSVLMLAHNRLPAIDMAPFDKPPVCRSKGQRHREPRAGQETS